VPDSSIVRFRHVVGVALSHLEERREEINDLNVFPVADGDTGDNMALTMRHVLDELDSLEQRGNGDPRRPEIVIYEPLPNGKLQLVGADYLVFADAWHAKNQGSPQLMGQLMHLIEAPNRYGLPAFYTLHVWAWKESPTGTFVNWHKNISCDAFRGGVN